MMIYSHYPRRRALQLAADILALALIGIGTWIAVAATAAVAGLGDVGRRLELAGTGFQVALTEAAEALGRVPLVGDSIREPLEAASGTGGLMARAGQSVQDVSAAVAAVAGLLMAAVIVVAACSLWLRPRLRFARRAGEALRLAELEGGRDLLALRALASCSTGGLSEVGAQPAELWRIGDPHMLETLARLALREAGVRPAG